jgi:hypothetical protein
MKRIAIALLAMMVASVALPALQTSAQIPGTGTLRLGASQCPDGYTGENYAVDCAVPAAGIEFFIGTPNTDNVDSGVSSDFEPITFDLGQFDLNPEAPDTVWLGEWVTQTGDYAVSCTANGAPLPISYERIPFNDGSLFGIAFDFTSGDDIVCSWYRIDNLVSDDQPDDSAGGVVQLPATGSGPAAHTGWWR